jgi:hypothetical protein
LILMAAVSLWLVRMGANVGPAPVPVRKRDRRRR